MVSHWVGMKCSCQPLAPAAIPNLSHKKPRGLGLQQVMNNHNAIQPSQWERLSWQPAKGKYIYWVGQKISLRFSVTSYGKNEWNELFEQLNIFALWGQINYLLDNALLGSKRRVSLALWGEVEEKGELSWWTRLHLGDRKENISKVSHLAMQIIGI